VKVLLATPSYDGKLDANYVNSLLISINLCNNQGIDLIPIWISYDALLCRSRNDLLAIAINNNLDNIIWVDSDIEWNPEWILKLLSYKEDIVGGIYRKKTDEKELYVIKTTNLSKKENGLIKVEGLGCGFLKMSKKAFTSLWNNSKEYTSDGKIARNVFEIGINNNELIGEDIMVCNKLFKLGYDIYLDPNMTCNHIGNKKYYGDFNNYIARINKGE
jgi:hypothetical protein